MTVALYSASVAIAGAAAPVSSALAPMAKGTLFWDPFARAASGESGRTNPSTAGPQSWPLNEVIEISGGTARRICSADSPLRQAAGSGAPEHPAFSATVFPKVT